MSINNDIRPVLRRVFALSIQYLGIQQSATDILAILYLEKHMNESALSIKEIMRRTGLSLSSVSVLCTRLDAEGILEKRTDDSGIGRGRRKILYEFNMNLDDLFTLVLGKYIQEASRICRDIKSYQKQNSSKDVGFKVVLENLEAEICSFVTEHSRLSSEISTLWYPNESKDKIDLDDKVIESAL